MPTFGLPHYHLADWYAGKMHTNYLTVHITADGGSLCDACMRSERKQIEEATAEPGTNKQWEWIGVQESHPGEGLDICDHCGATINPEE